MGPLGTSLEKAEDIQISVHEDKTKVLKREPAALGKENSRQTTIGQRASRMSLFVTLEM